MLEKRNKSLKGQIHQLRYDERDEGEYLDMDTIIAKWFSTSEQKITWSISLAFFLIFPLYFWQFSFFLPDDATISGGAGVSGEWDVSFDETDVATSEESQFLMDGEEYVFEFQFDDNTPNLGYVEITVSHGETDESGPNPAAQDQCDNAIGQMRMGQVNDYVRPGSTTEGDSGSPNNCPTSYTMTILLMENYSGESYQTSGQKGEIEGMWDDNGFGRGEYRCQITLETRSGDNPGPIPSPGPTSNNEDGEEITVSWRVVGVEVSVAPVVVIDA
tara:strand:- start:627 stop:1445 length:819 start_codon:yes stop_codon:yes gene_type:complete